MEAKKNEGKRRVGICAFCGENGKVGRDHVPPKGLFKEPYPPNMITVPACDRCNTGSSGDDNLLRRAFALDMRSSNSAEQSAEKALRDPSLLPWMKNNAEWIQKVKTPNGTALQVAIAPEPILRLIGKISRGLIYHHTKKYEPRLVYYSYPMTEGIQELLDEKILALYYLAVKKPSFSRAVQEQVFEYRIANIGRTMWAVATNFYVAHNFLCVAGIPKAQMTDEEISSIETRTVNIEL